MSNDKTSSSKNGGVAEISDAIRQQAGPGSTPGHPTIQTIQIELR